MTAKLSSVYLHLVQIVPSFFPFSRLPRPEASGAELVCCAVQRFKKTKVCATAAFKIKRSHSRSLHFISFLRLRSKVKVRRAI